MASLPSLLLLWGCVSSILVAHGQGTVFVGFDQATYYVCETPNQNPNTTICVSVTGEAQTRADPITFNLTTQPGTATSKLAHQSPVSSPVSITVHYLYTGGADYDGAVVEQFVVDPSAVDVVQCFDFPPLFGDREFPPEGTENFFVILTPLEHPGFLVITQNITTVEISDDDGQSERSACTGSFAWG